MNKTKENTTGRKKLLIVESPAKAKTIGKYLGSEFTVKSSVGHIRDLPKEGGAIKIEPVGKDKWDFVPHYVVSSGKTKIVNELKAAVKDSDEIYLASDPDREGEAIAWHMCHLLGIDPSQANRITYNEISEEAVNEAIKNPDQGRDFLFEIVQLFTLRQPSWLLPSSASW